jgi:hypothetical protein
MSAFGDVKSGIYNMFMNSPVRNEYTTAHDWFI